MLELRLAIPGLSLILSLGVVAGCADDTAEGGLDDLGDEGLETGDEADTGEEGGDGSFGDELEFTLRITDDAPPPLSLSMDRDEVGELFGDVAPEIELLELDTTSLLTNTLNTVKLACGTGWQQDQENPNHDCSSTQLGQTFGDGDWQNSPEFSMVRILTMTPANSVVEGTSLNSVQNVTDFLSLFTGGFSGLLADSLKIDVADEFLSTAAVVASMKKNLIATHPETSDDGSLTITLEDALNDMATIADRLGPAGDHPGILKPEFPTQGSVFSPDFQMSVIAESNLRVLDGVDLSGGKDFISVIADNVGPSFDDEAEFDFNDPEKFSMSGLTANPTLDMRFAIYEHAGFVDSCTGDVSPACINNSPDLPIGPDLVWSLDPWEVEYLIAEAGVIQYSGLSAVVTKLFTDVVEVGQGGDPGGWAVFNVPLGWLFGEPPPQYVWELINEVAQHNLHHLDPDGPATFAEGDADVEFTLYDVPCGLTAAEAEAAVRPYLQSQASEIAGYLLGNYKENSGPVDFYYRRADDGAPYLFWVAQEDLLDGASYGWDTPGFYADSSLATKVSSTEVSGVGDTMHEKFRVPEGETTVYVADDEGKSYRVRMVQEPGVDAEILVYIAPRID